LVIESNDIELG